MTMFLVTVLVCGLYLGIAMGWPHAGRILYGVTYLATSLFNFAVTSRNPEGILDYGLSHTFIPFYAEVLNSLAIPHAMFFITALGVCWEAMVGVFVLSAGNSARVGFVAAILFNLLIAPLSPVVFAGNVLLAAGALTLLRYRFDEGAFEQFPQPPRRALL